MRRVLERVKFWVLICAMGCNSAIAENFDPPGNGFPSSCSEWLTNERALGLSAMYGRIPQRLKDKIVQSAYETATNHTHSLMEPQFSMEGWGSAAIAQLYLLGEPYETVKQKLLPLLHQSYRVRVLPHLEKLKKELSTNTPLHVQSMSDSLRQAIEVIPIRNENGEKKELNNNARIAKYFFDAAILLDEPALAERILEYLLYLDKSSDEAIQSLAALNKEEELLMLGEQLAMEAKHTTGVGRDLMHRLSGAVHALSRLKQPALQQRAIPTLTRIEVLCESPGIEVRLRQEGFGEDEIAEEKVPFYQIGVEAVALSGEFGQATDLVTNSLTRLAKKYLAVKNHATPEAFATLITALKSTQNEELLRRVGLNIAQSVGEEDLLHEESLPPVLAYYIAIDCFLAANKKVPAKALLKKLLKDFRFEPEGWDENDRYVIEATELTPLLERVIQFEDSKITAQVETAILDSGISYFRWPKVNKPPLRELGVAGAALKDAMGLVSSYGDLAVDNTLDAAGHLEEAKDYESEGDRNLEALRKARETFDETNDDPYFLHLGLWAHQNYLKAAWHLDKADE